MAYEDKDGVSYSFIKTNRFKTTMISVGFYLPCSERSAAYSLTAALMATGTKEYPDSESFNRKLASLYGANVSLSVAKLGDVQEFRISLIVNNDKYSMNGEKTVDEAGKLLCDMIFGRLLSNTDYPKQVVQREKRLLCEKIAGEINDKRLYARKRCEEIMCQGEPFGMHENGTKEQVNALMDEDINNTLYSLLQNSFISVIAIGENEPENFKINFFELLGRLQRRYIPCADDVVKKAGELKTVEERLPIGQGKLVLGFRSESAGSDEQTLATWVMCDVFGGGPYSRLFANVREKLSLCYYCSARAVRRKGIIMVDSGVEENNINATKEAVLNELSVVKNGDFTDEELLASKRSMCDMISSVESDQAALMRWYAARALEKKVLTPSEVCERIKVVTREDVIKAATGFTLDTVYMLRPDAYVKEGQQ